MSHGQEKFSNIVTFSTQKESGEEVDFEKKKRWMSLLLLQSESTHFLCASVSIMASHSTVIHGSFYLLSNAIAFPKENVTLLNQIKIIGKINTKMIILC